MTSRHRHSHSVYPNKDGDAPVLPTTFSLGSDDGSKAKPFRSRYGATFTVVQTVILAAASASLAAVLTALGASHYIMNHYEDSVVSTTTMSHTTQSIFSHRGSGIGSTTPGELGMTNKVNLLPSLEQTAIAVNDDTASLFEGRIQEPLFLRDDESSAGVEDGKPKVAWLMSFPNSGTSFTIHLTRESTNTTTATNYACEGDIKDRPGVPVLESSKNGPFLELIPERFTSLPPKYILTKTHCGGFCSDCIPLNYIETPRSFQISCQTGKQARMTESGLVKELVTYDAKVVKKAVHVIRHPLDNIVARFHLFYKRFEMEKDTSFTNKYPYNSTGFNKWCTDQDKTFDLSRFRWVDKKLVDTLKSVPCYQEFFRYIQWHNLAFTVTRNMGLPTLIIHYQDYSENLDLALKRLLTFLELPKDGDGIEFAHGKEYRDYYTPKQRAAVLALIKEQATAETWHYLKDYDFS